MVANPSRLPECRHCNGYGTADGQPCDTPQRDAWASRHGCRFCDGTGNARLTDSELKRLIRMAHELSSLADKYGVALEVSCKPRTRLIFRLSGDHRMPDLVGADCDSYREGDLVVIREHYEVGGADVTTERVCS